MNVLQGMFPHVGFAVVLHLNWWIKMHEFNFNGGVDMSILQETKTSKLRFCRPGKKKKNTTFIINEKPPNLHRFFVKSENTARKKWFPT